MKNHALLPIPKIKSLSKFKIKIITVLLICFMGTVFTSAQTIRYVKAGGTGNGNSWASASGDFQAIIDASSSGDEVWVAAGNFQLAQYASYRMKEGVKIYGGFVGTETNLSQRDWSANPTILIGFHEKIINNLYNGLSPAAVLDGFTLTYASTAAIQNIQSSPTIRNCIFDDNNAPPISNTQSSPVISNCIFINNVLGNNAPIIYNGYSNPVISNSVFIGNQSSDAIIKSVEGSPAINNCTFYNNRVTGSLGIITQNYGSAQVNNTIIWGNTAGSGNAGIHIQGGGTINVNYTLAQNYNGSGTGNLNIDPLFLDINNLAGADGIYGTEDDGLKLRSESPVIDKGNPFTNTNGYHIQVGDSDITGNSRIQRSVIDMGAYEGGVCIVSPETIYVDHTVTGSGSGYCWDTAFKTLNEALNFANATPSVKNIYIAKGTYYPTGEQSGTDRNATFLIPQRGGIEIYGGYPNGGGVRNIQANPTILSGNINDPNSNSDNSCHVMVMTNTLPGAERVVIDGLTITGGNANSGAQYTYNGVLTNQQEGGGVLLRVNSNIGDKIIIRNCTITKNSAVHAGGVYMWHSSALIDHTVISENTAVGNGGGIFIYETASPKIINSVIVNNTAGTGGGIFSSHTASSLSVINSTIADNIANANGNNLNNTTATVNMANSIVWGSDAAKNIFNESTLNATYSDIFQASGVYAGTGNINEDPLFENPAEHNYAPLPCSPVLNSGNNDAVNNAPSGSGTLDILGNPRIFGDVVDMGAYELQASPGSSSFTITTPSSRSTCLGSDFPELQFMDGENGRICFIINENATQIVTAPAGTVFSEVIFASYGNASGNCGTGFTIGSCHAANSQSIIEGLALGNNSFTVTPNNEIFGDPCSGTAKKLYITIAYAYPGSSYSYSWTNDNPAIGLPTSGTGNIPSFEALGTGTANITLTASSDACTISEPVTFTYTVEGIFPLHVDESVTVSGNGKSWGTAFKTLQEALAAYPGQLCKSDSILVAKGTYIPASGQSFAMIEGVKILGGYPNGGGIRDITNNPTILRGNNRSVIRNDNNGLTIAAVLDGFTITLGRATGADQLKYGGGIYNRFASPTISNCIFIDNDTTTAPSARGGGMYNYAASPVITNCTFSGNDSYDGGAIYNDYSSPLITHCIFTNNSSDGGFGGAIYDDHGGSQIINSSFTGNKAITSNTHGGGAIYNLAANSTIKGSVFTGNESTRNGGAIYSYNAGSLLIVNSVFTGNKAYSFGGAIVNNASLSVYNCTFYHNLTELSGNYGKAIANFSPLPATIANSVFLDNQNNSIYDSNNTLSMTYSIIQGGYSGEGNTSADPIFVNGSNPIGPDGIWGTSDDGLRIQTCSPAFNAGSNNAYANAGENVETDLDFAGNSRLYGTTIDIGAYENQGENCPIVWIGTPEDGYWSNGSGPGLSDDAFVEGDLIITFALQAKNFNVKEGGSVFIEDGGSLTLAGKLTNENADNPSTSDINEQAASFIIKSGGNLIQTEDYELDENEGKITVERESREIVRLDYTLWSSPVKGQGLRAFSPETIWNRIYTYETTSINAGTDGAYVEVFASSADPDTGFVSGKGYLFRAPNNWNIEHGNQPTAYPGKFIGEPFNGSVSVPTYPGSYTSIGNPYPSNIDPELFLTLNPGLSTLYFWNNPERIFNETTQLWEYTGTRYVTYSSAGFVPFEYEGNSITTSQGFIVQTSGSSVNFTNEMRVSDAGSFFRNPAEKHRFWLKLSAGDSDYNQMLVSYMPEATMGVDAGIEGEQFGYSGSALYNLINEEKYTIQGRPLPFHPSDIVPLGFKAEAVGKFSISLVNFEGLFTEGEVMIYLNDKYENIVHNLMKSDYEFKSRAGEYKDRFEVVYRKAKKSSSLQASSLNDIRIYKNNDRIVVESDSDTILEVELYNLHGRMLHSNKEVNSRIYSISSGILGKEIVVVTAKTESGELVTKKVINK